MTTFITSCAMVISVLYSAALCALAVYGMHSLWLLYLYIRQHKRMRAQEAVEKELVINADNLPVVLVQIPLFNERDVAEQAIAACAALQYPKNKLHIQVLDDSTDDTGVVVHKAIATAQANGISITHVTRTDRVGYKAGAMAHGLSLNDAPFVAIFDADFQPQPDFLQRAIIPFLNDDRLALVQGRWDHANRHDNALTNAQALGIDSHFGIEQGARAWNNLTLNFNGTCGLWRRAAIDDAGGWQHDTLTEDMDLSYRAQLRGWRCTYRNSLVVPGELPATLGAWRTQQFRWAKGSLQTMVKLAGPIVRSSWSWHRRIAALLHVSHYLIHPLIFLSVLCAPLALLAIPFLPTAMIGIMIGCFALGATAPFILYTASQLVLRGWSGLKNLRHLPMLTAMGTGIAVSNSRAAWEVLRGLKSPFIRTPKQGLTTGSYRPQTANGWPEIILAGWSAAGLLVGFNWSHAWMAPLLWLYTGGFTWIGWRTLRDSNHTIRDFIFPGIALASLCCYGVLINFSGTWRDAPVYFATGGLLLGGLYVCAVIVLRHRHQRNEQLPSLIFIFAVAIAMRVLCLGMAPSDDLARYAIEGQQILSGENPYHVAPAQSAVSATLAPVITAPLNHGDWTAIYPPLALSYHTLVSAISPQPLTFQLAAFLLELITLGFLLVLMRQQHVPGAFILAAAWNPIGPLFITGEGHHDILMALFIVVALIWFTHHHRRSIVAMSCAALVKPFAVVALVPLLFSRRWWWWCVPPSLAILAYLPFVDAKWGVLSNLGRFGADMHFHGALEPFIREIWSWFLPDAVVRSFTILSLIGILFMCSAYVVRSATQMRIITICTRLFAILLLCLPTMHPWYFVMLVVMLPFTRSYGLLVWTALAPVYWLHGIAIQSSGIWIESGWVTSLAHVPALVILAWEAAGRPTVLNRRKPEATLEMSP